MICFEVCRRANGQISGLSATGHADYAAHGQDIVCAAVTAICGAAITGMTDLLKLNPSYELEEGRITLAPAEEDVDRPEVQLLLETAYLGVLQLEEEYGRYLKVITRENSVPNDRID